SSGWNSSSVRSLRRASSPSSCSATRFSRASAASLVSPPWAAEASSPPVASDCAAARYDGSTCQKRCSIVPLLSCPAPVVLPVYPSSMASAGIWSVYLADWYTSRASLLVQVWRGAGGGDPGLTDGECQRIVILAGGGPERGWTVAMSEAERFG